MGRFVSNACAFACLVAFGCGALAGCQDRGRPADGMASDLGRGEGALAWQGMRRCADCDGIESQLTLRWSDDDRAYRLVETYLAHDGAFRFEQAGDWHHRRGMILLEGSAGERHAYRLLDDGRLHARNADGSVATDRTEDMLLPMGASHEP